MWLLKFRLILDGFCEMHIPHNRIHNIDLFHIETTIIVRFSDRCDRAAHVGN
jgi:hypothetical protein